MESENPEHIATSLETLEVTLRGGKDFVAKGEGRNALGSPLLALGFLARVLAAQSRAPPLLPGEVITTGTLTALPYLRPGESYRVEVAGAPLAQLQLELGPPFGGLADAIEPRGGVIVNDSDQAEPQSRKEAIA